MNTTTQSPRCDDLPAVVEAGRRAVREAIAAREHRNHSDLLARAHNEGLHGNDPSGYWSDSGARSGCFLCQEAKEAKYIADTAEADAKYWKATRAAEKEYGDALRALGYESKFGFR
jgi:hypothetical protein